MLIMAIILIVLLGTVGLVISNMYISGSNTAVQNSTGGKAFDGSEAAALIALKQMITNDCHPSAIPGATTAGNVTTLTQNVDSLGTYTVTITGTNPTGWNIQAINAGSVPRSPIRNITCTPGSAHSVTPIIGGTGLSIGNNVTMNGSTIANTSGGTNDLVTTTAGTYPATAMTFPTLPTFQVSNNAQGNSSAATINPGQWNKLTGSGMTLNNSTGSIFYITEISIGNNTTLTLKPGNYYIDKINLGNNAKLLINPTGEVRLYIKTEFKFGNNNEINKDGLPENLKIFLYDYGKFELANTCNFSGLVIAPGTHTEVKFGNSNNNYFKGAVACGGTVDINNNLSFTYTDASLTAMANEGVSVTYSGSSSSGTIQINTWQEPLN
ncbi:MAG: hypothetical protein H7832_07585 [Magnetococcus sp. DMHC-6]